VPLHEAVPQLLKRWIHRYFLEVLHDRVEKGV